jgi:hypothetical protein
MLHCVNIVRTDVSEEHGTSIIGDLTRATWHNITEDGILYLVVHFISKFLLKHPLFLEPLI